MQLLRSDQRTGERVSSCATKSASEKTETYIQSKGNISRIENKANLSQELEQCSFSLGGGEGSGLNNHAYSAETVHWLVQDKQHWHVWDLQFLKNSFLNSGMSLWDFLTTLTRGDFDCIAIQGCYNIIFFLSKVQRFFLTLETAHLTILYCKRNYWKRIVDLGPILFAPC